MSTEAPEAPEVQDHLCPQCYGKEWVTIQGRKVRCTCVANRGLGERVRGR